MGKKRKDLMREAELADEVLNIPKEEIWTYRIEGLQAPRIVDKTVKPRTKALIIVVLIAAISLSIFFSIRAVSNVEYKYAETETGLELVKYSNPGGVTEVTVDLADGDAGRPVTELHEYAFNCDEKITTVYIGKNVTKIDGKSFYSCWNLENVFVDDENPCYCDIDGVLYDKELTEIIYYPSAHNIGIMRAAGYTIAFPENGSITNDDFCGAVKLVCACAADGKDLSELTGDDAALTEKLRTLTGLSDFGPFIDDYREKAAVYVLPPTVTSVGKLALAYSDVEEIYLPEGLKTIGTLGFFKAEKLREIYTYRTDGMISGTSYEDVREAVTNNTSSVYRSLPDGLEAVGSDAFTYDRGLTYLFLPSSLTEIGHHAFFNTAYKSGDVIEGIAQINAQADKETFHQETKTGESWLPKLDAGLFKKNVEVLYSSERE